MKKICCWVCVWSLLFSSCQSQTKPAVPAAQTPAPEAMPASDQPVAEYVVNICEDSKGNLWFGTVEQGVARYDGKTLRYFTTKDGLVGNSVVDILEDKQGNIWLGTQSGVCRYDGTAFTNFTETDGLCHFRVSNLLIDKSGTLWVGTWGGVCLFNGIGFTRFDVPLPQVEVPSYNGARNRVTELLEDSEGNVWIGRDGYGACRYDGRTFTHFTKKDGLASNNVQTIAEDCDGNIWFGSRVAENDHPDPAQRTGDGGVSRYDGHTIVQFPNREGLTKNETYALYVDDSCRVWMGANKLGVYCYDPAAEKAGREAFRLYKGTDRMDLTAGMGVQSILQAKGKMWFGLSGGLFRLENGKIVHLARKLPWE